MPTYLAIDIGAESGRAMLGRLSRKRLTLTEVHRFRNEPVVLPDAMHWDVLRLFAEIKNGLRRCVSVHGPPRSVGVDTWGVDFGLLGRDGALLGNPVHYRDPRTDGMAVRVFRQVPRREVFERTGIQFMEINTLYQWYAMRVRRSPQLDAARHLLLMGDLVHYFLTGRVAAEVTNASTTQCYDPRAGRWATSLLGRLGLPTRILPPLIQPGTALGPVLAPVAEDTGAAGVRVIAPATHDTACAVAAVPAEPGSRWAYLSSGTWSLVGVETGDPVITDAAYAGNFTNEVGVGGTIRLLKNVMGLWLVQECCRAWEKAGAPTPYDRIAPLALKAPAFRSLIDPDDPRFVKQGGMPTKIQAFCRETRQPVPTGRETMLRCILESLALKYRWVIEKLEALRGERIDVLHVVGGGSRIDLLNQFTADALGRPVLAGPVEATAMGNALVQAMAYGEVASVDDARAVIRASIELRRFEPRSAPAWNEMYGRLVSIVRPAAQL